MILISCSLFRSETRGVQEEDESSSEIVVTGERKTQVR